MLSYFILSYFILWISHLCLKMSSFLHLCTCVMPRKFHSSCGTLFPVSTPENISGLQSVVTKQSRRIVINIFSGNIEIYILCKGCLPSKVVVRQWSSSIKGHLPSKVVFRQRSSSIICCLP